MTPLSTASHKLLILVSKADIGTWNGLLSGSWKPHKVKGHAILQVSAAHNLLAARERRRAALSRSKCE
jgi:hypothetical protein